MRRALDVAPGRFIRRYVTVDIEWQLDCDPSGLVVRQRPLITYISRTHGVHASQHLR